MQSIRQTVLDQIFLEAKKLFFAHSKRASTVASLQRHQQAGTFPADLNFHIHDYKLPSTINSTDAATFKNVYTTALNTYQKTIFDARLKLLSDDLARLKIQLDNFYEIDPFSRMVNSLFGNNAISQTAIPDLLTEARLKYSIFIREQENRQATRNQTSGPSDSMAVDTNSMNMSALLRRIEQLEINRRRTSNRGNRQVPGPSFGNAENRGRSPRPIERNASPFRHGRSTSNSRPRNNQTRSRSPRRQSPGRPRRQSQPQSRTSSRSSTRSQSRPSGNDNNRNRSPSNNSQHRENSRTHQRNRPATPRGGRGRENRNHNDNHRRQRRPY